MNARAGKPVAGFFLTGPAISRFPDVQSHRLEARAEPVIGPRFARTGGIAPESQEMYSPFQTELSPMPRMSPSDLKAILSAEKADALAAISAARLAEERADAMDYYLGYMVKDMPAQDGRSRAVSTDVADTIEGLMPLRADFQHLRRWRKSVEQAQSYTFKAVITIIVAGFVGAVWLGIKVMLGK